MRKPRAFATRRTRPDSPETVSLWPAAVMAPAEFAALWERLRPSFLQRVEDHRIPPECAEHLAGIYLPLSAWLAAQRNKPTLVLGINGAQGSGKSTLADFIGRILEEIGRASCRERV